MARISEVRYVGYAVPDLEAERRFYADVWKLREVGADDGLVYFAAEGSDAPYVVRLRQSDVRRVDVLGWATETRADVDALFAQVKASGAKVISEPHALTSPGGGWGFRFFDLDGETLEISAEVARGPSRKLAPGEGVPAGISHIVLHSPNHKGAVQFYQDVLGFRVSDWLGDFMCFLRCNPWHHRLAFLPGPPCLNHVAYDVPTVDDMMRGIGRLKQNAVDIRWGPGRHTAGNNAFSYFTTPADFAVEYTTGLEAVDEATWQAKVLTPTPQVMDQWGAGVGGPQAMPHPAPDPGVFQAAGV